MGQRLRLLLIRDCVFLVALISVFYLPDPYGIIVLLVVLAVAAPRFQKTIRDAPELPRNEKHIYAGFNIVWVLVLVGLLWKWARQHPNSRAWVIASAATAALILIFFVTIRQVYGSWPPRALRSEQAKFAFVVGSLTLLALACAWLFRPVEQRAVTSADSLVKLVPPFLLLGVMYFVVLRQRRQFFPTLHWIRMLVIMLAFACVFIAVVARL